MYANDADQVGVRYSSTATDALFIQALGPEAFTWCPVRDRFAYPTSATVRLVSLRGYKPHSRIETTVQGLLGVKAEILIYKLTGGFPCCC